MRSVRYPGCLDKSRKLLKRFEGRLVKRTEDQFRSTQRLGQVKAAKSVFEHDFSEINKASRILDRVLELGCQSTKEKDGSNHQCERCLTKAQPLWQRR